MPGKTDEAPKPKKTRSRPLDIREEVDWFSMIYIYIIIYNTIQQYIYTCYLLYMYMYMIYIYICMYMCMICVYIYIDTVVG